MLQTFYRNEYTISHDLPVPKITAKEPSSMKNIGKMQNNLDLDEIKQTASNNAKTEAKGEGIYLDGGLGEL